jgi:hypothetical protein
MNIFNRFRGGSGAANKPRPFKSIQIGIVVDSEEVQVNNTTEATRAKDLRYNADSHAIRVRLVGEDNKTFNGELANCFPLIPKYLNAKPINGELVFVFMFGEDEAQGDRFYIGPFISTEDKLGGDFYDSGADSHFSDGKISPGNRKGELKNDPNAFGVYEDPKNLTIEGRDNTDIIQKSGEVLIRSGKFILNNRRKFNEINPGYIQLKFNQEFNEKELNALGVSDNNSKDLGTKNVTVTNIVANKINLLSHDGDKSFGGNDDINLTNREGIKKGSPKYISDETMDAILNRAHPLVFGDKLVEYLQLLKEALFNHIHNEGAAAPATDRNGSSFPLAKFKNDAPILEKAMLSKNIRIN